MSCLFYINFTRFKLFYLSAFILRCFDLSDFHLRLSDPALFDFCETGIVDVGVADEKVVFVIELSAHVWPPERKGADSAEEFSSQSSGVRIQKLVSVKISRTLDS